MTHQSENVLQVEELIELDEAALDLVAGGVGGFIDPNG